MNAPRTRIHLVVATGSADDSELIGRVLESAGCLLSFELEAAQVRAQSELFDRVRAGRDDLVLLDWSLVGAETPQLAGQLLDLNPQLRIMVLLPLQVRQYREALWQAGACSTVPKEYLDQEWLSSALCLVYRSIEREARLRASFTAGSSVSGV